MISYSRSVLKKKFSINTKTLLQMYMYQDWCLIISDMWRHHGNIDSYLTLQPPNTARYIRHRAGSILGIWKLCNNTTRGLRNVCFGGVASWSSWRLHWYSNLTLCGKQDFIFYLFRILHAKYYFEKFNLECNLYKDSNEI